MIRTIELDFLLLKDRWPAELPFREAMVELMDRVRRECTWTVRSEEQFQVACAILLTHATGADREWLDAQLEGLKAIGAILAAAEAGLTVGGDSLAALAERSEAHKREYTLRSLRQEASERSS